MSERNQTISALMDDEHNPQVLESLVRDKDMQAVWSRYHLIGDCLRDPLTNNIAIDIADRVSEQLASEPTILAPVKTTSALLKRTVGFAIAASVAMIAVLGIQTGNNDNISTPAPTVAMTPAVPSPTIPDTYEFTHTQVLPAAIKSDTPASISQHRMNGYLVNHNEYRSVSGMTGIPPYVRIVTIETRESGQE